MAGLSDSQCHQTQFHLISVNTLSTRMICQCVYVHFELDNTYTTILKIKTIVNKLTYVWANGQVDGRMER